jgi:hypothetical protein
MRNSNKFLPSARAASARLSIAIALAIALALLCSHSLAGTEPQSETVDTGPVVAHALSVELDPQSGTITATDRMSLDPDSPPTLLIQLHRALKPEIVGGKARLEPVAHRGHLAQYRLTSGGDQRIQLRYQGRIQHGLDAVREGMGRERQQSIGTISPEGVFLSGYSGWYPRVLGALDRLVLEVEVPEGWLAVSQGQGPSIVDLGEHRRIGWQETAPQDALYLIAAPFELYRAPTEQAEAQAFLRGADEALAARYLDATATYLERYSALIGDYPYAKFALVENFWESGYGMPSFTLLGPRVLRLPFILHSSYPHEILHNWWGNGVYVDHSQGNWSEGLTAYLADHLNQELAGKGSDYRRDQLKAYADYVRDNQDMPLSSFQGRHGAASQAIGYGKVLMLFHMLRTQLGDETFVNALRRFYRENLFAEAGWDDIQGAFEAESGTDLSAFFTAWTSRPGAPTLSLNNLTAEPLDNGRWRLSGQLRQTQDAEPFPMTVPIVLLDEHGSASELTVPMEQRQAAFSTVLDARPARIAVDPRFDSFRTLAEGEATATLSNLFGAERGLILIPADAPTPLREAYQQLANAWQRGQPGWSVALDNAYEDLPADRAIWLLGWDNRWLPALTAIGTEQGSFELDAAQQRFRLLDQASGDLMPVISTNRDGQPFGWIGASSAAAVAGLTRKLPHYGKYGYLLFEGSAPTNVAKGQWPAGESDLSRWLTEQRPQPVFPPRANLLEAAAKLPAPSPIASAQE